MNVAKNIIFIVLLVPCYLFSTSFNPTIPTYNNNKTINIAALIQAIVSAIVPSLASPLGTINLTPGVGTLGLDVNEGLQITTGFESWTGGGAIYYSNAAGSFTVTQAGTGYINSAPITWAGAQTISGLVNSNHYFIYMDSAGTIGKTITSSLSLFQDNIVLFSVMVDSLGNQIVCKDNHVFTMPVATYNYIDTVIGPVIENNTDGANIVINANPQKIQINGADVLNVDGLTTTIPDSASVGVSWQQMYTNASGKWTENGAPTDTFVGQYSNAGVVTALTAGRFGVYTLYVGLDDLNSSAPKYFAVLDNSEYVSQIAARNAIDNGTVAIQSNEFKALDLAQLGFIIFDQTGNEIVDALIEKTTISAVTSSGGTNNASLVITDTATFDGILSPTDTNVQQALQTINDWGKYVPTVISRTLTNAELKALHTTPVTIISAPGAGKIVDVLKCMVRLTYGGSNVFTTATGTIQLRYNTSNISIIAAIASNDLIVGSVNQVLGTINGGQDLANYSTGAFVSNQAVEVFNPGAAIAGNAANDNTITVVVTYQTITI